jgi:hypothetical protein
VRFPRTFGGRLTLAVVAGLVIRLLYVALVARKIALFGDAVTYHEWARTIANGTGWVRVPHPELGLLHVKPVPSAEHPPLFSLVLAGFWKLGVHSYAGQKLVVCFIGASTVAFTGLAGREAAGERTGLIAAAIAAVYPFLWVADGALLAESLYAALIAASLWLALRFLRTRSLADAAWFGGALGLAALSRGEALFLVPLLLVPLAWTARSWRAGLVMLAACAIVIAPWTIRNLDAFGRLVPISNNDSTVIAGANCGLTYHGTNLGSWDIRCISPRRIDNEAAQAAVWRSQGVRYARDHAARLPVVLLVRLARVWDLWQPRRQVLLDEGRQLRMSQAGVAFFYLFAALGVAGALALRRRGRPLLVLLSPAVAVCVAALVGYGIPRLRHGFEIPLLVLAAAGIAAVWDRLRERTGAAA